MIVSLDEDIWFPSPYLGDGNGFFAAGGDLSELRLMLAYANGIFPWYAYKKETIYWCCPLERYVILPHQVHVSHSMRTLFNKKFLRVVFDGDFVGVLNQCRFVNGRDGEENAWLGQHIVDAYLPLFNKGNKADFRNVVLIMTSNAGAQYAAQASVGFGDKVPAGEAMLRQVKKTFKPEFINRLTATVVFNDMSRDMAWLILEKKLYQLESLLAAKKVSLTLSQPARELLLEKGFTREYGAREIDRVVGRMLKPLLMREILFGRLQQGGEAFVGVEDGELRLEKVKEPAAAAENTAPKKRGRKPKTAKGKE